MNKIDVRLARKYDMKELAKIQTSSWKSAFTSILSKQTLDMYTDAITWPKMLEQIFDGNRGIFTLLI